MKLNSEESEALLSRGQHMSPLSQSRSESVLVDMAGDSMYSPTRRSSKSEPVSRVHCIPILMVFVFFVLWAASSEVKPDLKMATPNIIGTSEEQLKVINNEIALPRGRTVLYQDESSHSKHADPSLRNKSQDNLPEKSYIRGRNARSDASR